MLSPESKNLLKKQGYRVVGNHSAVKTCGWTKNMIRGRGGCYKLKFYGILSHRCMQMTSSISCANRCIFCWRDYKAPISKKWKWKADDPTMIVEESLKQHYKFLLGFGGNPKVGKERYGQSKKIKHVVQVGERSNEPIEIIKDFMRNECMQLFHH